MAFCRCCFVQTLPTPVSSTERPVLLCDDCSRHFSDDERRTLDHERMMANLRDRNAEMLERVDEKRESAEADRARLQNTVDTLAATIASEYLDRPTGEAKAAVEAIAVTDASRRTEAAVRSRDHAMAAVFRLLALHHEAGATCSCGRRITECPEFAALSTIRADYERWERQQVTLLRSGAQHGLPLDHPEGEPFRARSWEWKGMPAARPRGR